MIHLIVPEPSPRIEYACQLVFGRLLGLDHTVLPAVEAPRLDPTALALWYGPAADNPGLPALPCEGLLSEAHIREPEPGRLLHPLPAHPPTPLFERDPLAAVFRMASLYPWHQAQKFGLEAYFDLHGRFLEVPPAQWQTEPTAHRIARDLGHALRDLWPELELRPSKASWRLSMDIDHPWLHARKPLGVMLGGMAMSILKGKWGETVQRGKSMTGGDPNHIFDDLPGILPPQKSILFFLLERRHAHDGRHTWRSKAYRRLIQRMKSAGYAVGIHPSYAAWDRPDFLEEEKGRLEDILGEPVRASRQHYLRVKLPDTYRALEAAGIREEYSLAAPHYCGWRGGMGIPYPWYDLDQERISALELHPACAMDRSLMQYMKLKPEEAIREMDRLKALSDRMGGEFLVILHNEVLSQAGEWKGWKKAIRPWLKSLQK